MSIRDIVEFYKIIERDAGLRSELVGSTAAEFLCKAVELGKRYGLNFTEEELTSILSNPVEKEDVWISDDELDRMGPGPHPCLPSGTGALELLALAVKLRQAGRSQE